MGICKLGAYSDNKVVKQFPVFCVGCAWQPQCSYYEECLKEHGITIRKRKQIDAQASNK